MLYAVLLLVVNEVLPCKVGSIFAASPCGQELLDFQMHYNNLCGNLGNLVNFFRTVAVRALALVKSAWRLPHVHQMLYSFYYRGVGAALHPTGLPKLKLKTKNFYSRHFVIRKKKNPV